MRSPREQTAPWQAEFRLSTIVHTTGRAGSIQDTSPSARNAADFRNGQLKAGLVTLCEVASAEVCTTS